MRSDEGVDGVDSLFKVCVRSCACDEALVATFNRIFDCHLKAPVEALLHRSEQMPAPTTEEGAEIAYFLGFVHMMIWPGILRARRRRARWSRRIANEAGADLASSSDS